MDHRRLLAAMILAATTTLAVLAGVPLLPAQAVATNVALWNMNEVAGDEMLRDSSGNNLNGTIVQPNDQIAFNNGVFTWVRKGPQSLPVEPERIISVPDNNLLDVADSDIYTLEVRYKTRESFGNVVQKGQAASRGGQIKLQQPLGMPSCLFKGSLGRVTARTSTPINDGNFHTVTCVRSPARVQIFVDGILKKTTNGSTGAINNSKPYSIGGKTECDQVNTTCDYFTGSMEYVRVAKG